MSATHKRITGDGTCNGRNDMEVHRPRPRNKPAAVAAHNKQVAGGATYTVCGVSALPRIAPTPNPTSPAPTAEPLPACAGAVSESAAIPIAAVVTVILRDLHIEDHPRHTRLPIA